jgi:CDP-6-deoxy-D-xylo-4-hexulose-3-dehydrase
MEYKWPLSIPQFSKLDKLKLAKYVLTNDRWTYGDKVQEFERAMAKYVGSKYAIFTSSGSTANTMLAMMLRDKVSSERNIIVFPSTTWITSVSPFIREGYKPAFVDINMEDFSMNLTKLDEYLSENSHNVACVFVTSLIGFTPNMGRLRALGKLYGVRIMMDNCENTLGQYGDNNVSSFFTSTTSTYFGHQLQSVEGGFIFTGDEEENDYYLMARNHGMLRHLSAIRADKYRNPEVDAMFDFAMLGNNFRNTNINAFLGLSDLQRASKYFILRRDLYTLFASYASPYLVLPSDGHYAFHAPFCLPMVLKPQVSHKLKVLKDFCNANSIETRPIISGNLLRQTCLSRTDYATFVNSEYLHQNGFYVGLHGSTKQNDVEWLAKKVVTILSE